MPRPRKEAPEGELRVTIDPTLAAPLRTSMQGRGFGNETEFVRHMVRVWLAYHGVIPPIGLGAEPRPEEKKETA